MKNFCGVVEDLLPLYLENSCSRDSAALVETHLKTCPVCRSKHDTLKESAFPPKHTPPEITLQITACAKKVRRHRLWVGLLTVVFTFLAACFLFLSCLAVQDMRRQAEPYVHPVEEGVYNLTASDLETTAGQVGSYVFYTNYTQIQVSVPQEANFDGQVLLWDAGSLSSPAVIQYGHIGPDPSSCVFYGLSSSQRYMVTCDADEDVLITVSEGRNVNFFHSLWSVLKELASFVLQ